MAANAFVCWLEADEPWHVEARLLRELSLPLNLDGNREHAFYARLCELRGDARALARELPVWTPSDR